MEWRHTWRWWGGTAVSVAVGTQGKAAGLAQWCHAAAHSKHWEEGCTQQALGGGRLHDDLERGQRGDTLNCTITGQDSISHTHTPHM